MSLELVTGGCTNWVRFSVAGETVPRQEHVWTLLGPCPRI